VLSRCPRGETTKLRKSKHKTCPRLPCYSGSNDGEIYVSVNQTWDVIFWDKLESEIIVKFLVLFLLAYHHGSRCLNWGALYHSNEFLR
jgi:hypothetical protein